MRYLLGLLLLFAIGLAYSQKPDQSKTDRIQKAHSTKPGKQVAPDPYGSENNPLVVKRLDAEETAERRKQQATERAEKAHNEERLILWTIVLAAATILLAFVASGQLWMFWKQLGLMKNAVRDGTRAANAAKDSANAVMLAERAYVKMSHVPPGVRWFEKNKELFQIEVEIKNYGRTPASVTDVKLGAKLLENGELLREPFFYHVREAIPNAFLVTNEAFFHQGHFPLRGQDLDDAKSGTKKLWIFGHVDYIDTFKTRHRSGYVRVYIAIVDDGKQNNLFYMTEARYNYDRPRTKGEGNDWGNETTTSQTGP